MLAFVLTSGKAAQEFLHLHTCHRLNPCCFVYQALSILSGRVIPGVSRAEISSIHLTAMWGMRKLVIGYRTAARNRHFVVYGSLQ